MGNKFGSLSLLCPTPTSQRRYHETANSIWKYLPLYIMHIFNDNDDNLENRFLHLCKSSFPCWRLTRLFSSTLGMKQGQTKSTKSLKIGTDQYLYQHHHLGRHRLDFEYQIFDQAWIWCIDCQCRVRGPQGHYHYVPALNCKWLWQKKIFIWLPI